MNSSIEIVMRKIGELKPYENNPRHNDMAVDAVAASIQQFGFKNPVIIDKDGVIVAGHTRYKAAKKLGITDIPCISADDLSDEQIKAFRLADNKTAELAEWDEDLLGKEMQGIINIDMSQFGFSVGEDELGEEMQDDKYTLKVKIPQYEITGECPEISDMLDSSKADGLTPYQKSCHSSHSDGAITRLFTNEEWGGQKTVEHEVNMQMGLSDGENFRYERRKPFTNGSMTMRTI